MEKEVNFKSEYEVSDGDIYLTIVIGNGQPGSSIVKINKIIIKDGEIKNLKLGNGNELKGKTLSVTSYVDDYQVNTNDTCIQYLLTGGKEPKKYYLDATVDVDGDRVVYNTDIKFI